MEGLLMDRTAVSSSNVHAIGYDPTSSILEVEFTNGSVYQYFDVPDHEFDGLMNAGSHGTYLNAHIKGKYSYSKM
jgi:uncharacterized protein